MSRGGTPGVKRPPNYTPLARRFQVLERDGYRCVYCGADQEHSRLEVDHLDPAGGNDMSNLVTACFECNRGKGSRSVETPFLGKTGPGALEGVRVSESVEERVREHPVLGWRREVERLDDEVRNMRMEWDSRRTQLALCVLFDPTVSARKAAILEYAVVVKRIQRACRALDDALQVLLEPELGPGEQAVSTAGVPAQSRGDAALESK